MQTFIKNITIDFKLFFIMLKFLKIFLQKIFFFEKLFICNCKMVFKLLVCKCKIINFPR